MAVFVFVLGLAAGSFINVLAPRYDPDKFLLDPKRMGGRSKCPHCGKTLRWFELVPLVSFAFQGGRCRSCRARISLQYPAVELIAAFLAAAIFLFFVPSLSAFTFRRGALAAIWILIFLSLLLISLIDIRLKLIPDELNLFLALLGAALLLFGSTHEVSFTGSFLGKYSLVFGFGGSALSARFAGALFGAAFFGALVTATRGKGMGMGDVKLAAALGLIFGWPDIALIVGLSFVIGSLAGGGLILSGKKKLKNAVPFGPFLALGALVAFFFGERIVEFYFSLFSL